ncbi:MAG TPA: phage terminase small subunit P27 family [Rhizomicrobium sp.]
MRTKPRKPTRLKALEGRLDPRYASKNEPKPLRSGAPSPPEWLTPAARSFWDAVVGELAAMGVIARIDFAVVQIAAEAYSAWRRAEEVVERMRAADATTQGLLMRMPGGSVVANPAIYIAASARRDLLKALAEIGLTPSARAHLEAVPDEGSDEIWRKYFPAGDRRG